MQNSRKTITNENEKIAKFYDALISRFTVSYNRSGEIWTNNAYYNTSPIMLE